MINQKKLTTLTKKLELKHQCYDQIYVDYSDVYIVVKGNILTNPDGTKRKKSAAFKNNAPFINCISKISDVQIDNAEVLDVVMLIYNLLEYSKNYRKTTGNLGNCYRDEPIDLLSSNSKSLKYKTSVTGNTYIVGADEADCDASKVGKNETELAITLKHFRNFCSNLNLFRMGFFGAGHRWGDSFWPPP